MTFIRPTFRILPFLFLFFLPAVALHAQTAEQKAAASAFIDALVGRDWERLQALIDPMLKEKISLDQWKELVPRMEKSAGPLRRHVLHGAEMNHAYASITHYAYFEKDSVGLRVVVDSLNFVGGFWIDPIKRVYAFPPPPYADTTAFTEKEVQVGDSLKLPGVLSIPRGKGPFPAVVLVHGSGPQDMDETIQGFKPFRDIAWGLASRGVMVLRYVKRTKKYGMSMNLYKLGVEGEVLQDARSALRFLAKHPKTDRSRLVLLGHSLGATLAPEIALSVPAVRGVVMLAPIARPLEQVIADQLRYIASVQDSLSTEEAMKLNTELDRAAKIEREELKPQQLLLGAPASYYYDLHAHAPKPFGEKLRLPVFVARGEKDYQAPQADFEAWRGILAANPKAVFRSYPSCFHIFVETTGRAGPWNYDGSGHVTPALIEDLASWCRNWTLPPVPAATQH